jgi:hypothetical protein
MKRGARALPGGHHGRCAREPRTRMRRLAGIAPKSLGPITMPVEGIPPALVHSSVRAMSQNHSSIAGARPRGGCR